MVVQVDAAAGDLARRAHEGDRAALGEVEATASSAGAVPPRRRRDGTSRRPVCAGSARPSRRTMRRSIATAARELDELLADRPRQGLERLRPAPRTAATGATAPTRRSAGRRGSARGTRRGRRRRPARSASARSPPRTSRASRPGAPKTTRSGAGCATRTTDRLVLVVQEPHQHAARAGAGRRPIPPAPGSRNTHRGCTSRRTSITTVASYAAPNGRARRRFRDLAAAERRAGLAAFSCGRAGGRRPGTTAEPTTSSERPCAGAAAAGLRATAGARDGHRRRADREAGRRDGGRLQRPARPAPSASAAAHGSARRSERGASPATRAARRRPRRRRRRPRPGSSSRGVAHVRDVARSARRRLGAVPNT